MIFLTFAFLAPPCGASGDRAGANAGISLRFSPSARGAAMGDAFTAAATGVAALHYNPAGLPWTAQREISFLYQDVVLDVSQGSAGIAWPLAPRSAWGALIQYVSYGSTQRTLVSGLAGVASGTFTGSDILADLSYGARMGNWGWGVSAKVFSSEIDGAAANAFATDLGLRWQPAESPLALGVTLRNLGTSLVYDRERERLPLEFRLGAAWEILAKRLLITTDVAKVADENWSGHAGLEYTLANRLALRAGWDGAIDVGNGLTFGAGFRAGNLTLDYAYVPFGKVGNNHRIGLNVGF